ncbi:hypothetical protein WR25_22464 [Diploscapter pachys]|uniref:Uncharacterized protein n=1 Tax=Diploscapter pachys TaxID=2018661 RepID=A0A2A2KDU3_9BILA|nr:hypothetical protein WR25_22464 [Diploscapter pachys]
MSSGQSQPPAVSDAIADSQPIPSSPRSHSHVILPSPSSTVQKSKQQNEDAQEQSNAAKENIPINNSNSQQKSDSGMFGLYEEEQQVEQSAERNTNNEDRPSFKSTPALRSVSCPKGPAFPSKAVTSPQLSRQQLSTSTSNIGNSSPPQQNSSIVLINGEPTKKPKKVVSDYYKKQNELLENFKNDSEQIQVFQKTRTRQRLQSSTSTDAGDLMGSNTGLAKVPNEDDFGQLTAPLLQQNDKMDEPTIVIRSLTPSSAILEVPEDDADTQSNSSMIARHHAAQAKENANSKTSSRLANITFLVNLALLLAKVTASLLSGSISIISSMVDSLVDLTSGFVISISSCLIKKRDPYLYPRGRTRLEPLSLILISVIMGMASVQLIIQSGYRIHDAVMWDLHKIGQPPTLDVEWPTVGIMVATICIKFTLFCVCQKYKSDPSIAVLAMDHRNDCVSNSVALACAWLGKKFWYYLDPIGAILVSLYILFTWVKTGREYMIKLSGRSAKPDFINRIIKVCIDHDERISALDTVFVYHYGTKFLVEVHIVLDENMPLKIAHDISETLQINIESLPEVERAFVHTDYDYEHRPQDEHKIV